mgnify:CR=1 FL=1
MTDHMTYTDADFRAASRLTGHAAAGTLPAAFCEAIVLAIAQARAEGMDNGIRFAVRAIAIADGVDENSLLSYFRLRPPDKEEDRTPISCGTTATPNVPLQHIPTSACETREREWPVCKHGRVGYCNDCEERHAPRCRVHRRPWSCGECGTAVTPTNGALWIMPYYAPPDAAKENSR